MKPTLTDNLTGLQEILDAEGLTPTTRMTAFSLLLEGMQTQFDQLRNLLSLLALDLNGGFSDHDETGAEFCPLCDCSKSKGHADACAWERIMTLAGVWVCDEL